MFENFIIDERNIEHLNKKLVLVIYDIVDGEVVSWGSGITEPEEVIIV